MSWPGWVDWYADWQRDYRSAEHFSQTVLSTYGRQRYVLVGYSLGGEFIARLTHEWLGAYLAGVIVYESPLRVTPKPVPAVVQIWNDYQQPTRRRRIGKQTSIAGWREASSNVISKTGCLDRHTKRLPHSAPFRIKVCEGWDGSLNRELGGLVQGLAV